MVSAQFVSAQIVSAQIVSGTYCIGNKLYREQIVSGTNCIGNILYREQIVSAGAGEQGAGRQATAGGGPHSQVPFYIHCILNIIILLIA